MAATTYPIDQRPFILVYSNVKSPPQFNLTNHLSFASPSNPLNLYPDTSLRKSKPDTGVERRVSEVIFYIGYAIGG